MKTSHLYLVAVALLIAVTAQGQIKITAGKNANNFFTSYEDYKAEKPIADMKLKSYKGSTIEFVQNGTEQKQKGSKITYQWFCNETGILMRVFDGDVYFMVVDGPLCYYVKRSEGTVMKPDGEDYRFSPATSDPFLPEYYSEGPSGEIKKLKESVMDSYLEKYNLKKDFEADPAYKREAKDCVWCYKNKLHCRNVKYIKLINEKMK